CHHQAACNGIEQTAGGTGRWRHLGEHRKRQAAETLPQQHGQNYHEPGQAEACSPIGKRHGDGVAAATLCIERVERRPHSYPPTRALSRSSINRAMASTMKVITKRMRPSAIRAEV